MAALRLTSLLGDRLGHVAHAAGITRPEAERRRIAGSKYELRLHRQRAHGTGLRPFALEIIFEAHLLRPKHAPESLFAQTLRDVLAENQPANTSALDDEKVGDGYA